MDHRTPPAPLLLHTVIPPHLLHTPPATWPFTLPVVRGLAGCASAPPSWWRDAAARPGPGNSPQPPSSAVPWHCLPYSGLLLQPSLTFSPHLTPIPACLPALPNDLTHLPPTARPSLLALPSLLIHDRRPSPHTLTPFTAPSPLHHRTLPQHTPLR